MNRAGNVFALLRGAQIDSPPTARTGTGGESVRREAPPTLDNASIMPQKAGFGMFAHHKQTNITRLTKEALAFSSFFS